MKDAVRSRSELLRLLDLPNEAAGGADAAADFPLFAPRGFVARMRPGEPRDPLLLQVLPVAEESLVVPGFVADPVAEAAAQMRDQHVGNLVVVEPRGGALVPVGILTDRDIVVGVIAKGISPDALTVGDAMTREMLTVREDSSLEFALREMRRYGVRRAPVVRANGDLVGIIAVDDILQHLAVQLGRLADLIRVEQDAELRARP